ncbi:hypothetical protein ACN4FY_12025, partial [Aliarcobacter butzleri]|uniref:hypothetical protein n=1 Tax=Aliarcobacter butzleri TaxID=28197 RepID=UPI003AF77067
ALIEALNHRLSAVEKRRLETSPDEQIEDAEAIQRSIAVEELLRLARQAVIKFEQDFEKVDLLRKRAQKLLHQYTAKD